MLSDCQLSAGGKQLRGFIPPLQIHMVTVCHLVELPDACSFRTSGNKLNDNTHKFYKDWGVFQADFLGKHWFICVM